MAENAPECASSGDRTFWPSFAAGLKGKVSPIIYPYLNNPAKVAGVWKNGHLTLWVDSEFTRTMLNKQATLDGLKQAAAASFGGDPKVSIVTGKPPVETAAAPAQPTPSARADGGSTQQTPEVDALDELIAFAEQYDNIIIR
jgi:DNA polymerase-3 subunit gamma/tau